MLYGARERTITVSGSPMDYAVFGRGRRDLVLIPGLSLRSVRGAALPLAFMYRRFARDYRVWVFDRRADIPEGCTVRDLAEDVASAMAQLGIGRADVLGVSQGGMIAQYLAIDHPERVRRLALAVTLCRPNPTVREAVACWLEMADRGDYRGILLDTAERSYTEKRLRRERILYRVIGSFGKPESFRRFRIQAESCVRHDAFEALPKIACPTLVIGGTDDRIVTGEASREIAGRIPGCRLKMYDGFGHGLYEEAPDFQERVREFCLAPGEPATLRNERGDE